MHTQLKPFTKMIDASSSRLQRNSKSNPTQILTDLFRDANSMHRKIEEQIFTMHSLHSKSQHHVDFERQREMSGEQGGAESQITERDIEKTREQIAVLRERVESVKQALEDMIARSGSNN